MAISIRPHAEAGRRLAPGADAFARRSGRLRDRVFVAGASAFVVAVSLFAASRSTLFALRDVDVAGAVHLTPAEIRQRAGIPVGANVVWLDTAAVEARIEDDAWVRRAIVTRSLPWSVGIEVIERAPIAIVDPVLGSGTGTYVAADGTRLGPAAKGSPLPRIVLPPAAPATVALPDGRGAIRALEAMAPSVRHRVREIDVLVGGTLMLGLRGGTVVDVGRAIELDAKARALRHLLAWERFTGTALRRISIVAPTAPAASIVA